MGYETYPVPPFTNARFLGILAPCNLRGSSAWMKVDHTRQSYFLRDLDGSSMTKIDTHMYIHYLAHTQTLYLLLPDISDQSHINVDHGHQTIIRGGQSLLPAREKKHGRRQWMMELDQTSPFKRLTESQYLLSKAGHWEEGGRLRPLSQPGWQKMPPRSFPTTILDQDFCLQKRGILIVQQISSHPFSALSL